MGRAAVDQLLHLMDRAFAGVGDSPADVGHSLLANLGSVSKDDWLWVPPGGSRSVLDIIRHVGECYYVYDNHAFGDGSMGWDRPGTVPTIAREATNVAVTGWLREGHRQLREHVAGLSDDDLARPSRTNWGEMKDLRWVIAAMIEHDLYHAGEINHIRALHQDNDRWAWESA